ncbi:hypothetical protein AX774_g1076 [Zancudomyces culisetae]|uniref:Uncharacterized protein n=1 Tax=Zancudomyces culisetae TaxID=1213189 RepID=A0A1R1PWR3_ZANCU|nr:hypothetical protein AX774_g1076 [Zancudomyces culisetae]|eukprot:OMH85379.1 hypothetical protein AX774_g1076 [Zancudomyces culisetae]
MCPLISCTYPFTTKDILHNIQKDATKKPLASEYKIGSKRQSAGKISPERPKKTKKTGLVPSIAVPTRGLESNYNDNDNDNDNDTSKNTTKLVQSKPLSSQQTPVYGSVWLDSGVDKNAQSNKPSLKGNNKYHFESAIAEMATTTSIDSGDSTGNLGKVLDYSTLELPDLSAIQTQSQTQIQTQTQPLSPSLSSLQFPLLSELELDSLYNISSNADSLLANDNSCSKNDTDADQQVKITVFDELLSMLNGSTSNSTDALTDFLFPSDFSAIDTSSSKINGGENVFGIEDNNNCSNRDSSTNNSPMLATPPDELLLGLSGNGTSTNSKMFDFEFSKDDILSISNKLEFEEKHLLNIIQPQ